MIKSQTNCTDANEGLLPFDTAKAQILSTVPKLRGLQRIPIELARGRCLYSNVLAAKNVPPHANSAVDGYAVNARSLPSEKQTTQLEIAGTALAGRPFSGQCLANQCIRIMTGAQIPHGCDTVIMQEHVETLPDAIKIDARHHLGQNIRAAGEDMQQGQTVLSVGKFLMPADIGLLASLGMTEINVHRKLRIAIASTGDELCPPGQPLAPGKIYDSNRYTLLAALKRPDIDIIDLGILADDPEIMRPVFADIAKHSDVIIASGGVSVGSADYTRDTLQSLGKINFWKVAIKPGRPLAFGTIGTTTFFGLPGNPVAVMITFYLLVLPALEKMLGIENKPVAPLFHAVSTHPIKKKPGRTEIQRGILEQQPNGDWQVKTTGQQGSGILRSMSMANCFIFMPHDSTAVATGDKVIVQPFAGF